VLRLLSAVVGAVQVVNERLSPNCKARLTVENDDRASLYSVVDLMKVHQATGGDGCVVCVCVWGGGGAGGRGRSGACGAVAKALAFSPMPRGRRRD
jgi:hypothetical protein